MRRPWWLGVVVFVLAAGSSPAESQRPRLAAGADSNDATVYMRLANELQLDTAPGSLAAAESAFVWASRLAPGNADPYYARGVAILRVLYRGMFYGPVQYGRRPDSANAAVADRVGLLFRQAWLRDPFKDPLLDPSLQIGVLPRASTVSDPIIRGIVEFFGAEFPKARDDWARALQHHPNRIDLRFHRAYSYSLEQRFDSAAAELQQAITTIASRDSASYAAFAPPRDLLYYALAVAREQAGDTAGAHDAYVKALSENLGLYLVHARLARLLLGQGDTTGGLMELSIAAGVEPHDAWMRNYYGLVLLATKRYPEAVQELQAAIDADPYYASPYYLLGRADEAMGSAALALQAYRDFLAHAAVTDSRWGWVTLRVGELQSLVGDSVAHDD